MRVDTVWLGKCCGERRKSASAQTAELCSGVDTGEGNGLIWVSVMEKKGG